MPKRASSEDLGFTLEASDYPLGGIKAKGWERYGYTDTKEWHCFKRLCPSGATGIFLGAGETELSFTDVVLGDSLLVCLKGYLYLVTCHKVTPIPSRCLGYTSMKSTEDMICLWNYRELVVIEHKGPIRYADDLVIDDLMVESFSDQELVLSGMTEYDAKAQFKTELGRIPRLSLP